MIKLSEVKGRSNEFRGHAGPKTPPKKFLLVLVRFLKD